MIKRIGLVVIGAAIGAVAYLQFFAGPARDASPAVSTTASQATPAAPAADPVITPELSAYQAAAGMEDPAVLEDALERALAEPYSAQQQTEIHALFNRLAALDIRRAVRFADTPGFDAGLVARAFQVWAANDADAALTELVLIDDPLMQYTIAEALLDVLGYAPDAIERIASSLPSYQWVDFQASALAKLARIDPARAMNAALSFSDPALRSSAALRVGAAWVHHDPAAAVAAAESLPRELQSAWRSSVAREWAHLDTEAFLAYAQSQPGIEDLLPGLMHSMGVDPERVFEVAAMHDPLPIGEGFPAYATVERTAFTGIVMSDPQRAFGILDSLPQGERRRALTIALAESYGRTRPEEAIAWVRSLVPRDAILETSVIAYGGTLDQTFQWMYEYENPEDLTPYARNPLLATWNYIANIAGPLAGGHPERARFADQLYARGDEKSAAVLQRLTRAWVNYDPAGALEWMLSKGTVDPALALNIGGQLAARDAEAAAAYVEQLPAELRPLWLREVAGAYGRQDPAAAADWLSRYQGEPGFSEMLGQAVALAAQTDPQSAASMLLMAPPGEMPINVMASIASGWARTDLAGAARWAASIDDAASRGIAVSSVATTWATRDPAAAQRWAGSLPQGEARDQALSAVLSRLSRDGFDTAIDARLLDAFSSDGLRNRQITEIVGNVALDDPDRAQTLLQSWTTDQAVRRQGEELIERVRQQSGR